jgi:hypothetical protein
MVGSEVGVTGISTGVVVTHIYTRDNKTTHTLHQC